jgi:predicted small metal-binding protein
MYKGGAQMRCRRVCFMTKTIACDRVVPGCNFTADAATEDELIKKVAEHAHKEHGVADVTPDLLAKVKAAIVTK